MKVLVAIDSSVYADQVLRAVHKRLWPQHCEIRIITSVEPCANCETQEQFVAQSERILDHRVSELKRSLPQCRISGETAVGSASCVITDTASKWGADLIILGSHGDTGPRKSQIGSVAAAIVDHAPCTVELVKVHKLVSHEMLEHKSAEKSASGSHKI